MIITRKRWTPEDDNQLLKLYTELKAVHEEDNIVFGTLSNSKWFPDRTRASVQARYYHLINEKPKQTNEYSDFLSALELMRKTYEGALLENQQLKKRITELEQKEDDFNALTQIMDRARKLAFLGEAGEMEKPRFKMDGNGNLERVK